MLSYSIAFQDNKVKLLSYLTRKMDTWSVLVFPRIFFGRNIPHFYNAISELVRIEEIEDSESIFNAIQHVWSKSESSC
jgi:hypothetical protein